VAELAKQDDLAVDMKWQNPSVPDVLARTVAEDADFDHGISAAYTSAMSTAMKISEPIRPPKIILNVPRAGPIWSLMINTPGLC
jgi:hypothetical protein